jgi:hypothetical protein
MKNIYSILVTCEPNIQELNHAVKRLLLETNTPVKCNNSQKDVVCQDDKVKFFNFIDNLGIAKA